MESLPLPSHCRCPPNPTWVLRICAGSYSPPPNKEDASTPCENVVFGETKILPFVQGVYILMVGKGTKK